MEEKLVRVKGSKIVLNIKARMILLSIINFFFILKNIKYRKLLYLLIWNEIELLGIDHQSNRALNSYVFKDRHTHCREPG